MTGRHLHFVVPGPLDRQTGGSRYDAHMIQGLRERGWLVTVHELKGAFPEGDVRALDSLDRALSSAPAGTRVVVDGLAMGSLPEAVHRHASRLRLLALIHHPLADETGISEAEAGRLAALERRALEACRGVIVTSDFTGRRASLLLGVPEDRIRVVWPGTAASDADPTESDVPLLLSVGAVIPRKGHDILVEALGRIEEYPWRCVCVGSLDADREHAERVERAVQEAGLGSRVELTGEVERGRVEELLEDADVFVLASHFEGYGMALAEALARGLPIVSTSGGAIPDTVPDDAGILVPPGDADALARALSSLLDAGGRERRLELAAAARRRARELPDWGEAASRFQRAVLDLTPDEGDAPAPEAAPRAGTGEGSGRFTADWLEVREPYDHRVRAGELLGPLREWLAGRPGTGSVESARKDRTDGPLRIVDLGSGTGSNLRYLASRLPGRQAWTLVDRDEELLARAGAPSSRLTVGRVVGDLADAGLDAVSDADLVTGSALLDLVSEEWARELVRVCRDAGAAALFTLTYDGSVEWDDAPDDARDQVALVRDAFNAHQRRDKGLGPALGPTAPAVVAALFRDAGYRVRVAPSPWRLGPGDARLVRLLLDGWVRAAVEERPDEAAAIREWAARLRAAVDRRAFTVTVGHVDLLALPPSDG